MRSTEIINEIKKEIGYEFPSDTQFVVCSGALEVLRKNGKTIVRYEKTRDIVRAALILKSYEDSDDFDIIENKNFNGVSLMIDCSRNAVRNDKTVKKLIRIAAAAGYSSVLLYMEDTYEIKEEPMFGYLRGKYTVAELKELNAYADKWGVELIPNVQTLAHMNQLTRYKYSHFKCFDCSDILLVGSERTYELIDEMFATLSDCFTSDKIHVGMDEAWLLGRGKYMDENGCRPKFDIFLEHLNRVCSIADKYNLKPIIWSDMLWRIAYSDEKFRTENGEYKIPEEILNKVPKNLTLWHWDYSGLNEEYYSEKIKFHKQFKNPVWFAGGTAQVNRGFIPHLTYSMKVAEAAIRAAKNNGVEYLVETVWGDNGGECPVFAALPAIVHYSYTAKGIPKERLKKEFKTLTGYDFDDFIKIEEAQTFCGMCTDDVGNPAKYGLYNDVFSGYCDAVIKSEDKEFFKVAGESVKTLRGGEYGYLFETAYALNRVLHLKYDIGIRLRNAYRAKDVTELGKCVYDLEEIISRLEIFIKLYRKQWLIENKPQGLEIQEIRLGGLKERLSGCKDRLKEYLDGKTDIIPELEEELIPAAISRKRTGGRCDLFSYEAIASVNAFDGYTEVDV